MLERYKNIDIENDKVLRIINSAFEIFTKNDFEKASINNIIKSATVSKGLIYHYFKDKQDLFDFLFVFATRESLNAFDKSYDWESSNFFDRYKMALGGKLEVTRVYPYMIDFFNKYRSYALANKQELESDYSQLRDKLYRQNVDCDIVKDGVSYKKMVNIVQWTIKGMTQDFINNHSMENFNEEMDKFKADCFEYIDIIKEQFYK